MNTQSLADLHKIFPYDFYASLQDCVQSTFSATLSEFSLPVSNSIQKEYPEWADLLQKSVEARLQLFHQTRQNSEDISTQEEFENMKVSGNNTIFWTLTYAVPDDELKELPLSEPSAMNDYTGMLIYVHVQLLDGDGTELISETKPVPDPCWNIDDDRLLLCFHIIEHDEEGNTISTDKLLKTKAAELLVAKGKEND